MLGENELIEAIATYPREADFSAVYNPFEEIITAKQQPQQPIEPEEPMPKPLRATTISIGPMYNIDISMLRPNITASLLDFIAVYAEVKYIHGCMVKYTAATCPLFSYPFQFDSDEEGPLPKIQLKEVSLPYRYTTEEIIKHDKLMSTMNRMHSRIVDFLKRLAPSSMELHACRHCGEAFKTGRQLGGHMSRKHPGSSEAYNCKKLVHKFMKGQRSRRDYFRRLSGKVVRESDGEEEFAKKRKTKEKAPRKKRSYWKRAVVGRPTVEQIEDVQEAAEELANELFCADKSGERGIQFEGLGLSEEVYVRNPAKRTGSVICQEQWDSDSCEYAEEIYMEQ